MKQQTKTLEETVTNGFAELKALLQGQEQRIRGIEQREAGCHPVLESRIDAAWRKLDQHEVDIKSITETLQTLRQTNRILSWIGGLAGGAVILWVLNAVLGLIH